MRFNTFFIVILCVCMCAMLLANWTMMHQRNKNISTEHGLVVYTSCPLSKKSFPFLNNSLINKRQHEKWIFHPFAAHRQRTNGLPVIRSYIYILLHNLKLLMIFLLLLLPPLQFRLAENVLLLHFDPCELWTMLFKAHVMSSQAILHSYLSCCNKFAFFHKV